MDMFTTDPATAGRDLKMRMDPGTEDAAAEFDPIARALAWAVSNFEMTDAQQVEMLTDAGYEWHVTPMGWPIIRKIQNG